MAVINRFEDIIAWQKARVLCAEIDSLITATPLSKDYKLKDQINGSSGSIMDNIAKGFGRGGNLEFIQFLEISHGSACECQSQFYRIVDRKYIQEEKFTELYNLCEEIKKINRSLIHYMSSSENKGIKYSLRKK
jgi:four helix bundle protein